MEKLTRQEEKVMQAVWETKEGAIKDILENYNDKKKPHYNTIATVVKILETKGYVSHKSFGNVNVYYPLINKEEYSSQFLSGFIDTYFSNSYKNVVSFFAKNEKLSEEDLKDILKMIQKNKEQP